VALTFDDGPSGDNTRALMALLEEKDVRATFFLCGYRIEAFPALPEALRRAGHELGVHGYSHNCFDAMTPAELCGELSRTAALMGGADLVRPPCGAWNARVREAARDAGMRIILWSVDPEDWRCRDPEEIARRVCGAAENGSVILLHDLYPSSVEAAGSIIDRLRARGFAFCTVSELAERAGVSMEPGQAYSQFGP
jgi:peptidoglycan/xylan/chitin deacetylase (PgdA/CDA1 family)